ncbi:hypothetical protein FGO68_gene16731 [Halteria grandinella]|uniref:RING-type domain-containing protein n=1 Tax=Halteria grandinella TaxID=5974 RepID=A0A8J8NW00_HALGN|nr:hypothetical protein FGO68_gene16731 [Halteria grandinella]
MPLNNSNYSLEVNIRDPSLPLNPNDPWRQRHDLQLQQEFQEVQEAFTVWLTEFKEEDLKLLKLCLLGIVSVQVVIWACAQIDCGIPINQWLSVFSIFLFINVVMIARKLFIIDAYLDRIIARQMPYQEARGHLAQTIHHLKSIAVFIQFNEVFEVLWIFKGLKTFYSEDNVCSWEKSHSFGFILMFVVLTLGFILILKWTFKLLEIVLIVLNTLKRLVLGRWYRLIERLRGRRPRERTRDNNDLMWTFMNPNPPPNRQEVSFITSVGLPLRPDVYAVESILYSHQTRRQNSHDTSLDPRLNADISSLFFKVKKSSSDMTINCPICLEDLNKASQCNISLPCDSQRRHTFHEKCLQDWLKMKHECPLCKKPVKPHRATYLEMQV